MTDEQAANPADEPIDVVEAAPVEANTPAEGDDVADDFDDLIKEGNKLLSSIRTIFEYNDSHK